MRASFFRVLLSSLAAALIIVHATSFMPERKTVLPAAPPAPSAIVDTRVSLPVSDAQFPVVRVRKSSIIDHCFTANLDAHVPPPPGQVGLVAAALKQDWAAVRRMLDEGVSVETTDDKGVSALMAAAMQGNVEILRLLLDRHAHVEFADLAGRSALHYALTARKIEAVQLLLPLVSNLEMASAAGNELFTMALETGDMKLFQAVLERLPATLQWTANTRRSLEAALRADMKDQVRLLLSKHPAPPTRDGGVVPLIAFAIAADDATLFQTLLACGSDPNTVIPKAAEKDFLAMLKNKHLRLYIEHETGINLLMLAAGLGRTDYVRALLAAGADRSRATPKHKMIPLYFAAWTAHWQCVQLLLGGGPLPDQLRVEISLAKQNATVIKDGVTIFTTQVSTGRQGYSTPAGQYVITDKDRDHMSTIYKVPMPYFMRLNCRDFGMHAGVVPTYPASHGCIRLPGDAAKKLFTEIPVGTVVMIN